MNKIVQTLFLLCCMWSFRPFAAQGQSILCPTTYDRRVVYVDVVNREACRDYIVGKENVIFRFSPTFINWNAGRKLFFTDNIYRTLIAGQTDYDISYPVAGKKSIYFFRLEYNFITGLYAENNDTICTIHIKEQNANYVAPDVVWKITINKVISGIPNCNTNGSTLSTSDGTAHAYIKYGAGHTSLVKPIIFVDGLDLGDDVVIDPQIAGSEKVIRHGGTGWDVLITGAEESFLEQGDYETFRLYPETFQRLNQGGYDIIFLDFENGSGYIQKNAELLISLLERVNAAKNSDEACVVNSNIVVGASMGGQIARFALATMEERGQDHDTHTYVSFDSPQKGASLSMSMQALAWYLNKTGKNPRLWLKLSDPAPCQLLNDHFGNMVKTGKIDLHLWNNLPGYNSPPIPINNTLDYSCLRENYKATMNSLGYPKATRNIAIADGSKTGTSLNNPSHSELFHTKVYIPDAVFGDWTTLPVRWGDFGNVFDIKMHSSDGASCEQTVRYADHNCFFKYASMNENNVLFSAAIPNSMRTCVKEVPSTYYAYWAEIKDQNYLPNFDNAPGGTRNDLLSLKPLLTDFIDKALAGTEHNTTITLNDNAKNQCFIPTMSALDINWPMDNQHLFKNIKNENIIANNLTPFAAYYAPEGSNLKHVEIDAAMRDWLQGQLTLSGLAVAQITLPSALGSSYNLANVTKRRVGQVEVNAGGSFKVNATGSAGYGDEINNASPENYVGIVGYDCASKVIVRDGGVFSIGESSRKATVFVRKGSTVHIQSGGKLRLDGNSQLVVEVGGKLIIEEGAIVQLANNEDKIVVRGEIVWNGEPQFSGNGYFDFFPTHTLSINSPTGFKLAGNNQNQRFLQLEPNTLLNTGNNAIDLSFGKVQYYQNTSITVGGGSVRLKGCKLAGSAYDFGYTTGLKASNLSYVKVINTDVRELMNGLSFENIAGSCDIFGTTIQCDTVLTIKNVTSSIPVAISGCNMYPIAHDFSTYPYKTRGVLLDRIKAVHFSGNYVHDFDFPPGIHKTPNEAYSVGVRLDNVKYFRMGGGSIERCDFGIKAERYGSCIANVFLRGGALLANNTEAAINIDGDVIDVSNDWGLIDIDCASITGNARGIEGTDLLLNIDAIDHQTNHPQVIYPNRFSGDNLFRILYNHRIQPASVRARYNKWNTSIDPIVIDNYSPNGSPVPLITTPTAYGKKIDCYEMVVDQIDQLGKSCSLQTQNDGLWHELSTQKESAWDAFDAENYDLSEQTFAPIAAISRAERNQSSDICRQYIDVAKVMVFAPDVIKQGSGTVGGRSASDLTTHLWLEGTNAIPASLVLDGREITVTPNPASDEFSIRMVASGDYVLRVYDALGRLQHQQTADTDGSLRINSRGWQSGIYLLDLTERGKMLHWKGRVVIQRAE